MKPLFVALLLLFCVSFSFGFFASVNKSNSSVRAGVVAPAEVDGRSAVAPDPDYPLLAAAKLGSLQPLVEKLEPFAQFVDYALVGLVALVFLAVACLVVFRVRR